MKIWMNPEENCSNVRKKVSEAEKESEKARSELKECSEECSVMEHDLEYSKQTLTACNNLFGKWRM